jgi:hypothetical protein
MNINGDSAPTWPLLAGLYVLAGFVVIASLKEETIRQCEASSLPSVRQQLVFGAIWPATAGSMMRHHMNPVASILPPYGGGLVDR